MNCHPGTESWETSPLLFFDYDISGSEALIGLQYYLPTHLVSFSSPGPLYLSLSFDAKP